MSPRGSLRELLKGMGGGYFVLAMGCFVLASMRPRYHDTLIPLSGYMLVAAAVYGLGALLERRQSGTPIKEQARVDGGVYMVTFGLLCGVVTFVVYPPPNGSALPQWPDGVICLSVCVLLFVGGVVLLTRRELPAVPPEPKIDPDACFDVAFDKFRRGDLEMALVNLRPTKRCRPHAPSAILHAVIEALLGDFVAAQARLATAPVKKRERHGSLRAMAEALLHAAAGDADAFATTFARIAERDVGVDAMGVLRHLADHLARNGTESRWQLAPVVRDVKNPLLVHVARWPQLNDHVTTRL